MCARKLARAFATMPRFTGFKKYKWRRKCFQFLDFAMNEWKNCSARNIPRPKRRGIPCWWDHLQCERAPVDRHPKAQFICRRVDSIIWCIWTSVANTRTWATAIDSQFRVRISRWRNTNIHRWNSIILIITDQWCSQGEGGIPPPKFSKPKKWKVSPCLKFIWKILEIFSNKT